MTPGSNHPPVLEPHIVLTGELKKETLSEVHKQSKNLRRDLKTP
jgi:hypothetical protein